MPTWGELSAFTWGELAEMKLTNVDLHEKSLEELMQIARAKLDRFKAISPDKQGAGAKMIPLLERIVTGVVIDLTSDLIQSIDWKGLLIEVIDLLDQFLAS